MQSQHRAAPREPRYEVAFQSELVRFLHHRATRHGFVRAVRASPASAPPALFQEGATLSCSRSVPLAKQSIQNRGFVHLRCFMQEKVSSLVPHELSRVGIRCCPSTSAVTQLVSKRAATQRSWWRHPRPNPFIERTRTGMALQALTSFQALRALPALAAHVKR